MNGNWLKFAGIILGFVVVFAAIVGFAVRADMKADVVTDRAWDHEARLRAVETTLPIMAADIRVIRRMLENELEARRKKP